MFVDFYQNFSRDSTWSANEVVQFYQNIKSTIHVVCRIIRFFLLFCTLGSSIAEYNDRPIIEKKKNRGVVGVPENTRKSRKIKSIFPHLSEKIMACMI